MDEVLDREVFMPAAVRARWSEYLADLAVSALIDEVTLSPKPGLVDAGCNGAHEDLDWALMCRSARALRPGFEAMARCAASREQSVQLREEVGLIGRLAEQQMMRVTSGVNTHRGAIWSLGLLVCGASMRPGQSDVFKVARRAAGLARLPDRAIASGTGNRGERVCRAHGVGGARGQAENGFPHVMKVALPALWFWRSCGRSEDEARLNALLALIRCLDDTCVLARGGMDGLKYVQAGAASVLEAGGVGSSEGNRMMARFSEELLTRNLSPGGSADLLAATLFLDRLAEGGFGFFMGEKDGADDNDIPGDGAC
ncbi:MAG: triphosphoribosyl-dephospho-CoA synthase [Lautropia sp.]|nr:triphosphoribosyl-dephospho-CoA synthase [Lautropia sp.]